MIAINNCPPFPIILHNEGSQAWDIPIYLEPTRRLSFIARYTADVKSQTPVIQITGHSFQVLPYFKNCTFASLSRSLTKYLLYWRKTRWVEGGCNRPLCRLPIELTIYIPRTYDSTIKCDYCYKLVQGFRVTCLFTDQYNTKGYDMITDVIFTIVVNM